MPACGSRLRQPDIAVIVGHDGKPRLIGSVLPCQTLNIGILPRGLPADIDQATRFGALPGVAPAVLSCLSAQHE
jgi:hypothetical protein